MVDIYPQGYLYGRFVEECGNTYPAFAISPDFMTLFALGARYYLLCYCICRFSTMFIPAIGLLTNHGLDNCPISHEVRRRKKKNDVITWSLSLIWSSKRYSK